MTLTQTDVQSLFNYDEDTGILTRKISVTSNAKENAKAGWVNGEGYLNIKINKKTYKVHRIIWLYVYGNMPKGVIDHINMNKLDNRLCNLRDTTIQINNINRGRRKDNSTGIPNVSWRERDKRFYATCRRDGKQNYLGCFVNIEDAISAVSKFKETICIK